MMRYAIYVLLLLPSFVHTAPAPWLVNPSKLQPGRKVWVHFLSGYGAGRYPGVLEGKTPGGWIVRYEDQSVGSVRWEAGENISLRRGMR